MLLMFSQYLVTYCLLEVCFKNILIMCIPCPYRRCEQ